MDWKNLHRFPTSNKSWEVLKGEAHISGEDQVKLHINKWRPFDFTLISSPSSDKFLPPICIQEIGMEVFNNYRKQYNFLVWLSAFYLFLVAIFGAYLTLSSGKTIGTSILITYLKSLAIFFLIFIYIFSNHFIAVNSKERLTERTLFFQWLFTRKQLSVWILPTIVCIAGIFQVYYLNYQGSLDSLVTEFGALYSELSLSQLWRYFLGPFFHSNIIHFSTNLIMLIIVLFIIWPMSNRKIILVFFGSLICSVFVSQSLASPEIDGLLGISGGVFALYGWATGDAVVRKNNYPKYFWMTLLIFSLFNLLIPVLISPGASVPAHFSGYILGFIMGITGLACKPMLQNLS